MITNDGPESIEKIERGRVTNMKGEFTTNVQNTLDERTGNREVIFIVTNGNLLCCFKS